MGYLMNMATRLLISTVLEINVLSQVFRHGNRTPSTSYYNDPNENETFYPYGWDQLDNVRIFCEENKQ